MFMAVLHLIAATDRPLWVSALAVLWFVPVLATTHTDEEA